MPTPSFALILSIIALAIAMANFYLLGLKPKMSAPFVDEATVFVGEPIDWEGRTQYGLDGKSIPPPMQWTGRKLCDSSGNCYELTDQI